jgi:hypothetical protein
MKMISPKDRENELTFEGFFPFPLDENLSEFGGEGSGNFDHEGRPGQVGGSAKSGSRTAADITPEERQEAEDWLNKKKKPKKQKEPNFSDEEKQHLLDMTKRLFPDAELHVIDDEFGYAIEVVQNEDDDLHLMIIGNQKQGAKFTVGGQTFYAGGEYFADKREIQIYDIGHIDEYDTEAMLAHELEHDRWAVFKIKASEERKLIEIEHRKSSKKGKHILNKNGDIIIPEYEKKYPNYHTLQDSIFSRNSEGFANLDGVSEYSKSYWNKANDGTGSIMEFESAVNETLAEINRINHGGSVRSGDMYWKSIHPVWKSFYETVNNASK